MIDLKFLRENPEVVKENIKKKFQDHKLPLVDEVIELDAKARAAQAEADELRANKNKISKQIGALMAQGKKEEAEAVKAEVAANAARLSELEAQEKELSEKVTKIMMTIPNIIDPSVPIGKDDSENVEIERFGEPDARQPDVQPHVSFAAGAEHLAVVERQSGACDEEVDERIVRQPQFPAVEPDEERRFGADHPDAGNVSPQEVVGEVDVRLDVP